MTLEEMWKAKKCKGYTIAQISEFTGVPLGTLQKIFSGATASPRYETMQAIEKLLKPIIEDTIGEEVCQVSKVSEHLTYGVNSADSQKQQGEYTVEDYYAVPVGRRVELIDGVIYDMSAPSVVHQDIVGNVFYQISSQIKKNNDTCRTRMSPIDVQLNCDDKTMLQPDMIIVCNPDLTKKWGILGAPDFVLEVISESTRKQDYFQKMTKYMEAGVREYWVINPLRKELTVYDFMGDEGPITYSLTGTVGLAIYNGQIGVNLDEVAAEIQNYPEQ